MTLLQFMLLYIVPMLVCLVAFFIVAREDGYLKLSRLGTMAAIALAPVANIIFCIWLAALGLTLLGSLPSWDRVVWTRKKKPRP